MGTRSTSNGQDRNQVWRVGSSFSVLKFWELSNLTGDISQAEKKATVAIAEQLYKMTCFKNQRWQLLSLKMTTLTILSEIYITLFICSVCYNIYSSSQLDLSHVLTLSMPLLVWLSFAELRGE